MRAPFCMPTRQVLSEKHGFFRDGGNLRQLMARHNHTHLDMLKVDIEGSGGFVLARPRII
jgi:hypothetical protein